MTDTESEAVAWRVKDFADGWILCHTEAEAGREAAGCGNLIQPLFPASSLASRDARIAELEALLEEAVKGLKVINEIWVEAKRHSPDDDFDRGSRAARAEASDLARTTLSAIRGEK